MVKRIRNFVFGLLLNSVEDIGDFFEKLEDRLQAFVEEQENEAFDLRVQAEKAVQSALKAEEKAAKYSALKSQLPSTKI